MAANQRLTVSQMRVLKRIQEGYPKEGGGFYAAHHLNGNDQRIAARLGDRGLLRLVHAKGSLTWVDWHLTDAGRNALAQGG